MDDFADRTINELIESFPLFVDALKEAYDACSTIIDIIFSSCSIKTKTEENGKIICEAFDCFFEYQIYKIMEKYEYYLKISNQARFIECMGQNQDYAGINIGSDMGPVRTVSYLPKIYLYYYHINNTIGIILDKTEYRIKVEEKFNRDMLELMDYRKRICQNISW